MDKCLLKVSELAERLGCSRTTAYELVGSGRVRAVRLTEGGPMRVPVEAVEDFIDSLDSVRPSVAA
jgi:excisionase family DNA binding protein